jgi:hypothetical protein
VESLRGAAAVYLSVTFFVVIILLSNVDTRLQLVRELAWRPSSGAASGLARSASQEVAETRAREGDIASIAATWRAASVTGRFRRSQSSPCMPEATVADKVRLAVRFRPRSRVLYEWQRSAGLGGVEATGC